MRTALAVFAILSAAAFSGCAMNSNGYGGGMSGGLLSGLGGGCNSNCGSDCGCDSGCDSCQSNCGCNDYKAGFFPGPLASMRMQKQNCSGDCGSPCNGMGELALFSRKPMKVRNGGLLANGGLRGQLAGMQVASTDCDTCEEGCSDEIPVSTTMVGGGLKGGLRGGMSGGLLAKTEPRWNNACGDCGTAGCRGGCRGQLRDTMKSRVLGGFLTGKGEIYGKSGVACGPGCRRCGGRGLCGRGGPAAQHPYGGQIPHTDGFAGPHGPASPTYGYPYYTTRGPRDFLQDGCGNAPIVPYNPRKLCLPSIGW